MTNKSKGKEEMIASPSIAPTHGFLVVVELMVTSVYHNPRHAAVGKCSRSYLPFWTTKRTMTKSKKP
jgi:hypothetical protein